MFNQVEKNAFSNISATPADFVLRGGQYGVMVNATFGGGSVTLKRKSLDGSTYVQVLAPFSANGYATVNLPNGTYQLTIATATAVNAEVLSIVTAL